MSRFGDFAVIWFGSLCSLHFVVFRFFGAPFGIYGDTVVSAVVGLLLAAVLVFHRGVSLPTVVGSGSR